MKKEKGVEKENLLWGTDKKPGNLQKIEISICLHMFTSQYSYLSNRLVYQLSMQGDIFEKKKECRETIYLINVQGGFQGGF